MWTQMICFPSLVAIFLTSFIIFLLFMFSPHGGHSTAGDFDSEVDSTVSSRRGSRRRDKHINRNEGNQNFIFKFVLYTAVCVMCLWPFSVVHQLL